jgi:hypothetical protein
VAEGIARFSILHHFDAAQRGVVEFRSVFYFVSLIALCLGFTALGGRRTAGRLIMSARRYALFAALALLIAFIAVERHRQFLVPLLALGPDREPPLLDQPRHPANARTNSPSRCS